MQNLVVKIRNSINEIEKEKGQFKVKCLVSKRLDNIQWDLILAADWFDQDEMKRLNYLSEKIMNNLDIDEIIQFSSILTMSSDSDLSKYLIKIQNGEIEKYGTIVKSMSDYVLLETRHPLAPLIVCL